MNMRRGLPIAICGLLAAFDSSTRGVPAGPAVGPAEAPVPAAFPADRYQKMTQKSPFAPATPIAAPTPEGPPFGGDLYVSGLAKLGDKDFVTIQSRSGNARYTLTSGESAQDGTTLVKVDWSDEIGKSKVTVRKGSETGQLTFDQAATQQNAAAAAGNPGPNAAFAQPVIPGQPGRIVTAPGIAPRAPVTGVQPRPQLPGFPNQANIPRPPQPNLPSQQPAQINPPVVPQAPQPDVRRRTRIILNRPQ